MNFISFTTTLLILLAGVSASAAEKVVLALDWTPNTNHTGLYVAKAKGYFAQEGLDVTFIQPSQTTATMLVGSDRADFGVSFTSDLFRARDRKIPVVSIAAILYEGTACFAWRTSTGIKTVKDWEGKRYGGWGSPEEEETLKFVMKKFGADFSKLKIVTTGISDFLPSTEKNADFMWIFMGWDGVRAQLAGVSIQALCPHDLDPVFDRPSPLLIASEKTLKTRPELARKFLKAVSRGYELAAAKPKDAAEILLKEVPELDAALVRASAEFLAPHTIKKGRAWGLQEPTLWRRVGAFFVGQKLLEKVEMPEAYFTNAFLPEPKRGRSK